jgi:hypothetical protein
LPNNNRDKKENDGNLLENLGTNQKIQRSASGDQLDFGNASDISFSAE